MPSTRRPAARSGATPDQRRRQPGTRSSLGTTWSGLRWGCSGSAVRAMRRFSRGTGTGPRRRSRAGASSSRASTFCARWTAIPGRWSGSVGSAGSATPIEVPRTSRAPTVSAATTSRCPTASTSLRQRSVCVWIPRPARPCILSGLPPETGRDRAGGSCPSTRTT